MALFPLILFAGLLVTPGKAPSPHEDMVHWSSSAPEDGHNFYVCSGDSVSFAWRYDLSGGEALCDVQWFYEKTNTSSDLIAIMSRGKFVPLPDFKDRIAVVENAGFTMQNVKVTDSGKYKVEVHVYKEPGNKHTLLERSLHLVVSEHLMTKEGSLYVSKAPQAVLDPSTDEWAVQLRCGHFIFDQNPPFPVEWKTPKGHIVDSSDFSAGQFNLLLKTPVEGGNYTCRIPSGHVKRACLGVDRKNGEATLFVDTVDSRLTLVETETRQLKADLRTMLDKSQVSVQPLVAFHAQYLKSMTPPINSPLVFSTVHYNAGNDYNSTTGVFTTPVNGSYMFIATTGSAISNTPVEFHLYVDNTAISAGYNSPHDSYWSQSSVHGVVHLRVGQRVWVRSGSRSNYYSSYSSFSGFLLARDI